MFDIMKGFLTKKQKDYSSFCFVDNDLFLTIEPKNFSETLEPLGIRLVRSDVGTCFTNDGIAHGHAG